jgi:hypothetical protein
MYWDPLSPLKSAASQIMSSFPWSRNKITLIGLGFTSNTLYVTVTIELYNALKIQLYFQGIIPHGSWVQKRQQLYA